ncbi:hypothetical protein BSZ22_28845 [Bradyrhizobium canariense]|uniref:Uncharacterized protein n=1 Tax=Bradyrhizobium canariense TaxID=255045 RepID=A0A1X3GFY3_9BRAD|nr:hypothetical protein BSZ22_28845 [Bradyrhizobium canariense]OSI76210.1 hypothetical protein BSZ23_25385 [Bradyrhizobium canariense]OSI87635.1 hypothetical protein BSZ25_26895 [Bradyrhizobium canariense]OSI87727.1 hypothetical protein BSZ24_25980 [Bradyrhizobium canariense]OSI99713.1 hypothetical protein BSZ16_26835 [Bradyrhizobium canariense]
MNITEHRQFGIGLIAAIVALSALISMSVGLVRMIPLGSFCQPSSPSRFGITTPGAILNLVFGLTALS